MSSHPNEIENRFRSMENDELVERFHSDLSEDAREIARRELQSRGIPLEQDSDVKDPLKVTGEVTASTTLPSWKLTFIHLYGGFIAAYGLFPLIVGITGMPTGEIPKVVLVGLFALSAIFGILASIRFTSHLITKKRAAEFSVLKVVAGYSLLFATLKGISQILPGL